MLFVLALKAALWSEEEFCLVAAEAWKSQKRFLAEMLYRLVERARAYLVLWQLRLICVGRSVKSVGRTYGLRKLHQVDSNIMN